MIALSSNHVVDTVLMHRLGEKPAEAVAEACRRAEVRAVRWDGHGSIVATAPPALVVGSIPHGARRIPEDLVALVTQHAPGTPLLLLCAEQLASPTAWLRSPRVTLLSYPQSSSRLYSEICTLLARNGRSTVRTRGSVRVQEYASREAWVAELALGDQTAFPCVEAREGGGSLTAVVSFVDGGSATDIDEILALVRSPDLTDADLAGRLSEVLGERSGLVHFGVDAGTGEWVVYWPRLEPALVLYSPLRLPHSFDARTPRRGWTSFYRLPSAGSDVALALSSAAVHGATSAMASGGPALLDGICSALSRQNEAASGLVVEVL